MKTMTGRRTFLTSCALAGAAAVRPLAVFGQAVDNAKQASSPSALRITDLKCGYVRGSLFVKIHTNQGIWGVELAPWAVTIMRYGGMTILPQEPFRSHDEYLLPARPMTLWHYTDLSDPRWTFGQNFIRLQTDDTLDAPQKVGIANKQGWAGYWRNQMLFLKRVQYQKDARYPDYGCNVETFTAGAFVELETLGPLERLQPGQSAEHTEVWSLHANVEIGSSEASLRAAFAPILES